MNSVNLERSKFLYASCEVATIWYTQTVEGGAVYAGEKAPYKLRCKNYSPMKGDQLYPLFDEYDDMIALSVEYTRKEGTVSVTYFDTYTADQHYRWKASGTEWIEDMTPEPIKQNKASLFYGNGNEWSSWIYIYNA